MRLIGAFSLVFAFVFALAVSAEHGGRRHNGRDVFRFDTFGDEQLWTDVLRMHEAIAAVDPATALAVGL